MNQPRVVRVRSGRVALIPLFTWITAAIYSVVSAPTGSWSEPWSSWRPIVGLLPIWLFICAIPLVLLTFLVTALWDAKAVTVTVPRVPVVPRSWQRLSPAQRHAECLREIERIEREIGWANNA